MTDAEPSRRWFEKAWGPTLGIPGAGRLLVVGLVDSLGTGLYLAGSAVYFSLVLHLSAAEIGVGLTIAALLGFFAQPVIGWCADRFSPKTVLVVLHVWRALAFVGLAFSGNFTEFIVAAAAVGIGQQALSPVYQALVEEVVGREQRVPLMARSRTIYNIGFSLGGLLATIAIATGQRPGFVAILLGNALCCVVAAGLLTRLHAGHAPDRTRDASIAYPFRLRSLRDGRYITVAAVNGVLSIHISLLSVGIPLWVTLHTQAPTALVGILLVINTVVAVLFQITASKGSDTVRGGAHALTIAGIALIPACALVGLAGLWDSRVTAVTLLVAGVLSLTVAELYQSAGGWGLSYALAPEGSSRGEYLSSFNIGVSAQYVVGPVIVTVGVVQHGMLGWAALAAVLLLTTSLVGPLVSRAARRPILSASENSGVVAGA